jgi:hypothetical protein
MINIAIKVDYECVACDNNGFSSVDVLSFEEAQKQIANHRQNLIERGWRILKEERVICRGCIQKLAIDAGLTEGREGSF